MRKRLKFGFSMLAMAATLPLAGCGGGGGSVLSTPAPTPAPSPTPAPAPTPTPAPVDFRTAEYDRQAGLELSNAVPAYQAGATGQGVIAAVVDSGIDASSAEFAGRISPASQDLAGTRGIQDEGGHGTAVSGVLLAAKNDSGIHGVAFNATLLALRTDTPGSCAASDGCSHSDNAIARALDVATAQGAKVVNLSLGGTAANPTLRAAIGRATAAGMVIVISAGNDSAANPSDLALIATDPLARGQVIVAGSIDASKTISSFSNRAGSTSSVFVTALGEGVRSFDETGAAFLFSGTSFSAPFVSGAAALLAQAFPNLTGAQIVQLLLDSADDLGAAGVDTIYGHGALNIGRALAPRGGTSLAGSMIPVDATSASASLSPAMGDVAQKGMSAVILDSLKRAYVADLAQQVRRAQPQSGLAGTLSRNWRSASLSAGGSMVAVSIADTPGGATMRRLSLSENQAVQARATAGMIASRIDPLTSVAFGFGQSGASIAGQLNGRADPAFLVARGPGDLTGFDRTGERAASLRHAFGRIGVTAVAESGDGLLYQGAPGVRDPWLRSPYALMSLSADRRFGGLRVAGGVTRLTEDRTLLGAHFGPLFGGGGSASWFADLRADWTLGSWSLAASARQGWSAMGANRIHSNAFSFDIAKAGVLDSGDQFALRIAQPLRISQGGLTVRLPASYDYQTGAVTYADQRLNLAPTGREIDLEASYARMLLGGRMDANLFWRRDPGNFAAAPDDMGAALRWRAGF
ncbi:MAG: S8 family serine peptidase [Proteobacteria bacterium]|nr:S8 family serine peptidase [Pseudomonadota bacterium]